MSDNNSPRELVNTIDNLFGGAPVILFLGAKYNIIQYPELLSRPWSGIITTSNDSTLTSHLAKNNPREIVNVNSMKEKLIFGKRMLPIIYLNGINGETFSVAEDYDTKIQQEVTRETLLSEFVKAVNNTFGTILFAGYSPNERDEIPADVLYKYFRYLNHQAVWFFNVDENILAIKNLVSKGIAKQYHFDIGEIIKDYSNISFEDSDTIDDFNEELLAVPKKDFTDKYSIYINGKIEDISESVVRGFLPFGRLLTLSDMGSSEVSYSLITEWFYKFLKDSSSEPQWYGYDPRWQFSFKRDFEERLYAAISSDIENGQDKPIVLCGQTCCGKSIALAGMAWKIFHEHRLPVIFIQNSNLVISANAEWTNALSNLIEVLGKRADQIILIWDCSIYNVLRDERILQLQTLFKNRGKKLIIIASARFAEGKINSKYNIQNIPVTLSEAERNRLKKLLIDKGKIPKNTLESWFQKNQDQENLLALLYKLIFQIHSELELSLRNEIHACLQSTKETLEELPPQKLIQTELSAIGKKLVSLGLYNDLSEDTSLAGPVDWQSKLATFYRQLAVCSRFNLNMPVTLAMRLLKLNDVKYRNTIFKAPSLKFYEDTDFHPGEYTVSFRNSIEAEMYLSDVNGKQQYEIIAGIISELSDDAYGIDIDFVVRLLREVGPNSDLVKRMITNYYEYCPILFNELKKLREKGIFEPGLIIQEIVYIREFYGQANSLFAEPDQNIRIDKLKEAVQFSKDMLSRMEKGLYSQGIKNSLSVEYVFCWLALRDTYRSIGQKMENELDLTFDDAYKLLSKVISKTPNNSFAYVAMIKLMNAKLEDASTSELTQLFRDAGYVMELIEDLDIPDVAENENYIGARNTFNQNHDILFGSSNTIHYCDELINKGLGIGLYMKAKNLLRKEGIELNQPLNANKKIKLKEIIDILEDKQYGDISAYHPSCQYMLLRAKYLYYNSEPMFSGSERQITKLSRNMWQEILTITNRFTEQIFNSNPQLLYKNKIYYAQALAYAQLSQYSAAEQIFTKINEEYFYTPIRAKSWHLLCDENGTLIEFTGRFKQPYPNDNDKGYLWIKGFEKGVHYTNIGFLQATGRESVVDNLCIGMSFIGFVAYSKNHSIISGRR